MGSTGCHPGHLVRSRHLSGTQRSWMAGHSSSSRHTLRCKQLSAVVWGLNDETVGTRARGGRGEDGFDVRVKRASMVRHLRDGGPI